MSDKKENLTEGIKLLEELVRRAYQLISPLNYEYDLKWLMKQDEKHALFEKHPKCFLKLIHMGREISFFPICNHAGMIDPQMIQLSLKMVDKLVGNDRVDQDALVMVATKLKALQNKYIKEIPRPMEAASKKATVTKFINNVAKKFRVKK
jgi:hypothetical protein